MIKYLLILFTFSFSFIYSQNINDYTLRSLSKKDSSLITSGINKDLSTYNYSIRIKHRTFYDSFFLVVDENYLSNLIKMKEKNSKEEQFFTGAIGYIVNDFVRIGVSSNNYSLSDNRSTQLNSATSDRIMLYSSITPLSSLNLNIGYGFLSDKQTNTTNNGNSFTLEADLDTLSFTDYSLYSTVRIREDDINPRQNSLRTFRAGITNSLDNNISNSLVAKYDLNSRDFYFKADSLTASSFSVINNIEKRKEITYGFEDALSLLELVQGTSLQIKALVINRIIDKGYAYKVSETTSPLFDSKVEELKFGLASEFSYHTKTIDILTKLGYSEREETNTVGNRPDINQVFLNQKISSEKQKDNKSSNIILASNISYLLTNNKRIEVNLSHYKLRYDTPAESNYDDRDELLSMVRIKYLHQLNSFFEYNISLDGTINRLVYIFKDKSSNNNSNKVIRFLVGTTYTTKKWNSYNSFDISTNYTVFDYDVIGLNTKSYALRQFNFYDSTRVNLATFTFLKFRGFYRSTEQGAFNNSKFTMAPNREVNEFWIKPGFGYEDEKILAEIGLRLYSLQVYTLTSVGKSRQSDYLSYGPTFDLEYKPSPFSSLGINIYYEKSEITPGDNRNNIYFNMLMKWFF